MDKVEFEVKQSKGMVIAACCAASIFIAVFLGLTVFFLIRLCAGQKSFDEYAVGIISIIGFLSFAVIALIILVYIIYIYKRQIDTYTEDKMCRKIGDKIIFEIQYDNVVSIKQGYDSVFMVLKNPIVKKNGKKGPRNFYEHYSQYDILRIIRMITGKHTNVHYE